MKEELKSGIVEFDLLIEKFENGEINFVELTSALWNKGYKEGKKQAYSQTRVSSSLPLAELERRLDEQLGKETKETLLEWLNSKRL